MTDATALDPKVVCIFHVAVSVTLLLKYSHPKRQKELNTPLNDEWLYKTANDKPFAYE